MREFARQMDAARRAYDALHERLRIPDIPTHMLDTIQMDQSRLWEEGLRLRRAVEIDDENLRRSIAVMKEDFRRASAYYHEMLQKIRRAEELKRLRRIRLEEKLKEFAACTRPLLNAGNKTCGGDLSSSKPKSPLMQFAIHANGG